MAAVKVTKSLVINTGLAALAAFVGAFAFAIALVPAGSAITGAVVLSAAYAGLRFAAGVVAAAFGKPVPTDVQP